MAAARDDLVAAWAGCYGIGAWVTGDPLQPELWTALSPDLKRTMPAECAENLRTLIRADHAAHPVRRRPDCDRLLARLRAAFPDFAICRDAADRVLAVRGRLAIGPGAMALTRTELADLHAREIEAAVREPLAYRPVACWEETWLRRRRD